MKYCNIIKHGALAVFAIASLASCNDFLTIYPSDKIVGDEFWKKKEDVDNMVTGAYSRLISQGCTERAIIWGAYRSDELVKNKDFLSNDLDNISVVNLLPTNGYCSWGDYYAVINRCNMVLKNASQVLESDPNFSQGDYNSACGQMKALRALCHFYLVRAFRDVPFSDQAYETDDVDMQIAQETPATVLQRCIDDLEWSQNYVMRSDAYGSNNWRNKGFITRDAVKAILCDIYLWRASMTHSAADYQQVVKYADEIINSKSNYLTNNVLAGSATSGNNDLFPLYPYSYGDGSNLKLVYANIFSDNNDENIFELQYDGTNNVNSAVRNLYSGYDKDHKTTSIVKASKIFGSVSTDANKESGTTLFDSDEDNRFWNSVYEVNSGDATELPIRKFISRFHYPKPSSGVGDKSAGELSDYDKYSKNWTIYRLADIMLMKAEALVQLANDSEDDEQLKEAFNIVQRVNNRSKNDRTATTGGELKMEKFKTKADMEFLVLCERERELCFEGKRWFDLVRYCYRHMEGVNINTKIADCTSWPSLYDRMLNLIVRKYESGGDAVSYKMKSEPYLYWPIREGELKVNTNLKQNPVYETEKNTQKH